jgi:hypothetical protein
MFKGQKNFYLGKNVLKDKITNHYLKTHILKDEYMQKFRKIFFNDEL